MNLLTLLGKSCGVQGNKKILGTYKKVSYLIIIAVTEVISESRRQIQLHDAKTSHK